MQRPNTKYTKEMEYQEFYCLLLEKVLKFNKLERFKFQNNKQQNITMGDSRLFILLSFWIN